MALFKNVVKNEYGQRVCIRLYSMCYIVQLTPLHCPWRAFIPYSVASLITSCRNIPTKLFHQKTLLLFNTYVTFNERCYLSGNFSRLPSCHFCSSLIFCHSLHKCIIIFVKFYGDTYTLVNSIVRKFNKTVNI